MESIPGGTRIRDVVKFRSGLIAKEGQDTIKGGSSLNGHWKPGISSGGSVKRYVVDYQGEFLCCDPGKIKSGGVGTVNYFDPKLFVRQTGDSIICAYDPQGLLALNNVHIGERIPQGGVDLKFVCAVLNSTAVAYFYRVTSLEEGRAMAQIDIDMLDAVPLPVTAAGTQRTLQMLVDLVVAAIRDSCHGTSHFLEDLLDACVLECYFRDHMAERDLLFLDDLAPHLDGYDPDAAETQQRDFLDYLYRTLNAPNSKTRNRLLRISADSPDLLAVIKAEGRP